MVYVILGSRTKKDNLVKKINIAKSFLKIRHNIDALGWGIYDFNLHDMPLGCKYFLIEGYKEDMFLNLYIKNCNKTVFIIDPLTWFLTRKLIFSWIKNDCTKTKLTKHQAFKKLSKKLYAVPNSKDLFLEYEDFFNLCWDSIKS